jgi:hypothetical protein
MGYLEVFCVVIIRETGLGVGVWVLPLFKGVVCGRLAGPDHETETGPDRTDL